MSDSDMDIDDFEVEEQLVVQRSPGEGKEDAKKYVIAGVKDLRDELNQPSNSQNDVKRDNVSKGLENPLGSSSSVTEKALNSYAHGKLITPSEEQSKILKDSCVSFEYLGGKPALAQEQGSQKSCLDGRHYIYPTGNSQTNILSLELSDKRSRDNNAFISLGSACILETDGPLLSSICTERASGASIYGNSGKNIKLIDSVLRFPALGMNPSSFPLGAEGKKPVQKRAAVPCKFFAKGWCIRGGSCKFLHVTETLNTTSQQQANNKIAITSDIRSDEERRALDNKEGIKVSSQLRENGETSLHTRDNIFSVNGTSFHKVFPSKNEMHFLLPSESMGRESLMQKFGADGLENRSLVTSNNNFSTSANNFVHDLRSSIASYRSTDIGSSGPAWTGSLPSSVRMTESASALRHFENGSKIYGCESLPTLQGIHVSSNCDAEDNTASKKMKVSSKDWEPSEPFQPSFTIPPYILPSADALYDPFLDGIENIEDRSLSAPSSSKGKRKKSSQQKDGVSPRGPPARECSDDKNSSCSQNQHREKVPRIHVEAHGIEVVATSVVDQNDATPSKEISSAAVGNKDASKRKKPALHDSWHRSDGSSYKKIVKSDEKDGEVKSDAGIKVPRPFRTEVVETIKEMLKPLWHEGRLSKDVHNMIVKRATEKIISTAVQFNQVPTNNESIQQYLSLSQTKIVKLVEGYVEKYCKQ